MHPSIGAMFVMRTSIPQPRTQEFHINQKWILAHLLSHVPSLHRGNKKGELSSAQSRHQPSHTGRCAGADDPSCRPTGTWASLTEKGSHKEIVLLAAGKVGVTHMQPVWPTPLPPACTNGLGQSQMLIWAAVWDRRCCAGVPRMSVWSTASCADGSPKAGQKHRERLKNQVYFALDGSPAIQEVPWGPRDWTLTKLYPLTTSEGQGKPNTLLSLCPWIVVTFDRENSGHDLTNSDINRSFICRISLWSHPFVLWATLLPRRTFFRIMKHIKTAKQQFQKVMRGL